MARSNRNRDMVMKSGFFAAVFAALTFPSWVAFAAEQIGWRDLGVTIRPSEDPSYRLKPDQKNSFMDVLRVAALRRQGRAVDEKLAARDAAARQSLDASGLDVDLLLEQEAAFRNKIALQRSTVRMELDGRQVRIPGYLLPLEFEGTSIKEFLLVPYVGACIHTPPPPANQIIHVKADEAFSAQGLFTPVWVTGKLSTEGSKQSVGLSDGTSTFDVGYNLNASSVQIYE
jgi:uncharacterized protein